MKNKLSRILREARRMKKSQQSMPVTFQFHEFGSCRCGEPTCVDTTMNCYRVASYVQAKAVAVNLWLGMN